MKNKLEHLQEVVLCGLMTGGSPHHVAYLTLEDFTGFRALIFNSLKTLAQIGQPFDAISLIDYLKTSEHLELLTRHNGKICSESIIELINSLKVERLKLDIMRTIAHPDNFTTEKIFSAIQVLQETYQSQTLNIPENITHHHQAFMDNLEHLRQRSDDYIGIQSYLTDIDTLASGLCPSHLVVIAARPSVGKSALGLFLMGQALLQSKSVLFFSTEMDINTILGRLHAQVNRIPATHLTTFPKKLQIRDLENIKKSVHELENVYVHVKFGAHVNDVYDKAYALKKKNKLDMVVVDYLQNLNGVGETPVEKLSYISNMLKKLAMDLEVPVIALAQLNRQAQHMDVPSMAEIKGSGTIEQDADLVLLLHHTSHEEENQYWLLCVKNRHGEVKDIPVIFDKPYQNFRQDPNIDKRTLKKGKNHASDL